MIWSPVYAVLVLTLIDTSKAIPPSHTKFIGREPSVGAVALTLYEQNARRFQDDITVSDGLASDSSTIAAQTLTTELAQEQNTIGLASSTDQASATLGETDSLQTGVPYNLPSEDSVTRTIAFVTKLDGILLTVTRITTVTAIPDSVNHPPANASHTRTSPSASSLTDDTNAVGPQDAVAQTATSVLETTVSKFTTHEIVKGLLVQQTNSSHFVSGNPKAHSESIIVKDRHNIPPAFRARDGSNDGIRKKEKEEPHHEQSRSSLKTPTAPFTQDPKQLSLTDSLVNNIIETWHPPSGIPQNAAFVSTVSQDEGGRQTPVGDVTMTSQTVNGIETVYSTTISPMFIPRDTAAPLNPITTVTRPLWDGGYEVVTLCRRETFNHPRAVDDDPFDFNTLYQDRSRRQILQPFQFTTVLAAESLLETASTATSASIATKPPTPAPHRSVRLNTSTSIVCSESTWAVLLVFTVLFPMCFTVLMTEVFIRHIWFRSIPDDIKTRLLADKKYRSYERMAAVGAVSLACVLLGILVACYLRNGVCEDIRTFERPEIVGISQS
ncbi:hypothetical protein TWF696_001151 [Orbilia brochopaga]|uniref:Uncharacterized protein n=1 Tax=Orbilia brochopaga TaxID=3140254 RepID=A0AAV9VDG7_9PEZI